MKAVDYSNAPIVSTIDISQLSINKELCSYPQRNLASMTSMQRQLIDLEQSKLDEVNRLKREIEEVATGYEYISELEKVKRYTVNSKFMVACIDEFNQNKLYDLNNNPIEEEEWEDDDNSDDGAAGAAKMADLNLNGEYQQA